MKRLLFASLLHLVFFRLAHSLSPTYIACQLQKPSGESPLQGCPQGTLYVSPTDSEANFTSVQDAIDSLSPTGSVTILIGKGQYFERVEVTRSDPLTLLGQLDPGTASIANGNASQRNLVSIWNNLYVEEDVSDEETATFTVGASSGNSFGNVDLRVYNINFENLAANYAISRALVTTITFANVSFYGCAFESWQDTWYTGYYANTYVADSIIYGQTDYVFGCGVAWFQSITLANRACGGGITAWGGEDGIQQGVFIADSRVIRSPDANVTTVTEQSCYLGRPWTDYSTSVFLRTYMDDSIIPVGFKSWDGASPLPSTVYFAEFDSHGPGGDTSARMSQDNILTADQADNFTLAKVFGETPSWIDFEYQY